MRLENRREGERKSVFNNFVFDRKIIVSSLSLDSYDEFYDERILS